LLVFRQLVGQYHQQLTSPGRYDGSRPIADWFAKVGLGALAAVQIATAIDRFRPKADIGMSPIAAASRMLTHITIDSLAVQLSFHFVRHSQALGNTTR
jgi:hypothetical protein